MHGIIFSVAANSWKTCTISEGHMEAGMNPLSLHFKCSTRINLSQSQANHNSSVWTSESVCLHVYIHVYMHVYMQSTLRKFRRKFKKKTLPLWHTSPFSGDGFGYNAFLPSCGCSQAFPGSEVKQDRPEMPAGHTSALPADDTHTFTFLLRWKHHLGKAKNSAPSPHPKGRKPVMAQTRKGHITVSQGLGLCSVPAENGTPGSQLLFLGKEVHRAQTCLLKSVKARALLKPCCLQLTIF